MGECDGILFDLDGVLIDSSRSYRCALKETVEYILKNDYRIAFEITDRHIAEIKKIPGFNNEWDTATVLLRFIAQSVDEPRWSKEAEKWRPIDRNAPDFQRVFHIFQALYLGSHRYYCTYQRELPFDAGPGLIHNESLIIKKQILKRLKRSGFKLGVVTGRPRSEALFVLRRTLLIPEFFSEQSVVALEDSKREKPNPDPLLEAQKRLDTKKPVYVGDTVNDVLAAQNARMLSIFVGKEELGDYQISNVNQITHLIK